MITLASGLLDDVGGVEPAAEPDFEQQQYRRDGAENRRNAAAVSISNTVIGCVAVLGFAFGQARGELVVLDELAAAGMRRCGNAR